jgi:hypothetical protein
VKSGTEEAEMTSVGLLYLGEVLLVNAEEELASLVTHVPKSVSVSPEPQKRSGE